MASTIQVDKIQDTGGNTILSSNSTGTFTYSAGTGMGKVLQVVQFVSTDGQESNTVQQPTWADTFLTTSITPSATTSKILVSYVTQVNCLADFPAFGVKRDSTVVADGTSWLGNITTLWANVSGQYLDSPSTTSSTTYTIVWNNYSSGKTSWNGWGSAGNGSTQTLTLMEIGA